ncbi:MAG: ABC transporter permease subunit [Polyangiales bacterium]
MRAMWAIAKRDIRAFFVSPIAYVVLTVWLLWCGTSYYWLASWYAGRATSGGSDNPLTAFFGGTWFFFAPLLVFVPVMTMRLLAEEKNSGTLEPLLTAPVTEVQVVFGKYLAAMVFWITLWLPTLLYVWITSNFGDVDMGAVGASYLGIFGIGLYYMAIGLLMSAAARSQIVAAVLTFMVLGLLFAVSIGEFIETGTAKEVLGYVSLWKHMGAFSKGIVDTRYIVFDVSLAVLALFLAVRVLQSRRVT